MGHRVLVTMSLRVTDEQALRYFSTEERRHVADFDSETLEAVAARVFSNESISNIMFEDSGIEAQFISAKLPDGTPVTPAAPGRNEGE